MKKFIFLIILFLVIVKVSLATEMYPAISSFQADVSALNRKYNNPLSEEYFQRFEKLYTDWLKALDKMPYDSFSIDGKLDYQIFKNYLEKEKYFHQSNYESYRAVKNVASFAEPLEKFYQSRRQAVKPDASALAASMDEVEKLVRSKWAEMKQAKPYDSWQEAELASNVIKTLKISTNEAYLFYFDYDPEFTWWVKKPIESLIKSLEGYEDFLKNHFENTVVKDDGSGIIGKPIGKINIEKELQFNMIPYSAEELIKEGERQYAWCQDEMIKASEELGFAGDWRKALEHVKNKYVPAGEWPQMVVEMVDEAISYVEEYDLLTVPDMAKETWRTTMMSAARQKVSPFFLGGETIIISYPTSEMSHQDKMMSMRGNNPHFSRAVVHHELIPGHHLQQFMNQRHFPHRRMFNTPFWVEGWTLYWEFNLWDKGFPRNVEDKVGMLFWRMHRAARIVFSLKYHLGEWTPQQCIDFLVDQVGHERANAEAEVRRSFEGSYGPLYQLAYMIGGIQVYQLRQEMVEGGKMTEKEFHDYFITQNYMPIELLRARMKNDLPKDFMSSWRFLD
ncbi:DUF885 domain-containing protein [Belliella sp. DSM 111904]|uniref:DUF885 domain-containing protein n=1 Tax=Belliella filtrata TaxID=2923435 RepID=A0ABS9V4V6_9BACT|nr:DUF885 family protein [Belliella filtrata]MCH7411449.1 DUF885 domain-containing protein [Belliella filtrata]